MMSPASRQRALPCGSACLAEAQVQDFTCMPDEPKFSLEDARRLFDATPFVGWWGLTVVELGDGWATVGLPFREQLTRPGGILHGPSYEVVADVAMWLAIMTRTGEEQMAVTIEMKTSFLRGATTDITCRAQVVKLGRRIVFGTAETFDADHQLVAQSSLTYVRA
jgi:uncharacterized protein (TIGR00369 family)